MVDSNDMTQKRPNTDNKTNVPQEVRNIIYFFNIVIQTTLYTINTLSFTKQPQSE